MDGRTSRGLWEEDGIGTGLLDELFQGVRDGLESPTPSGFSGVSAFLTHLRPQEPADLGTHVRFSACMSVSLSIGLPIHPSIHLSVSLPHLLAPSASSHFGPVMLELLVLRRE